MSTIELGGSDTEVRGLAYLSPPEVPGVDTLKVRLTELAANVRPLTVPESRAAVYTAFDQPLGSVAVSANLCPAIPTVITPTYEAPAIARPHRHVRAGHSLIDTVRSWAERKTEPKFTVRGSTADDIAAMVEIDMRSFSKVYEGYGKDPAAHREELTAMFKQRFSLVGSKYMPVVTRPNKQGSEEIVGFMVSCPTSKRPEDFKSWEDTTDHGTLSTLYDPNGKNVYVVTLSMDPSVKGQHGQNLLYAQQVGVMIANDLKLAYFESRMPGLRRWVKSRCAGSGRSPDDLPGDEKQQLAEEYFSLTKIRNGKETPYDSLLKIYAGFGCKFVSLVADAYKDRESMDFGVVCTLNNPLPGWARKSKAVRGAAVSAINAFTRSSWLVRRAFN